MVEDNGRILMPGAIEVKLEVKNIPGNNVTPMMANLQGTGALQLLQIGGYTKLEDAAIRIAAAIVSVGMNRTPIERDDKALSGLAISLAETILSQCEAKQNEPPETPSTIQPE